MTADQFVLQGLTVRKVQCHQGPHDGFITYSSCVTALVGGEIYVDDGTDGAHFVHALTAVRSLPPWQYRYESRRVRAFMEKLYSQKITPNGAELATIPPWRVNAWFQLLRYGVEL